MSGLKSWREILASPLPEAPKEAHGTTAGTGVVAKYDKKQNADSLRVEFASESSANSTQNTPTVEKEEEIYLSSVDCQQDMICCLILGCREPAADLAYCREHRVSADGGTLWEAT